MTKKLSEKTLRKQLLQELQVVIESTAHRIQPLLQQEAVDTAEEKLEKFHRENPHQREFAHAIYKRLRERTRNGRGDCLHVKGLQPRLMEALGYKLPGPVHEDYNIGRHVFPDGKQKIWCLICGHEFTRAEAEKLFTTNSRTTSEQAIIEAQAIY